MSELVKTEWLTNKHIIQTHYVSDILIRASKTHMTKPSFSLIILHVDCNQSRGVFGESDANKIVKTDEGF